MKKAIMLGALLIFAGCNYTSARILERVPSPVPEDFHPVPTFAVEPNPDKPIEDFLSELPSPTRPNIQLEPESAVVVELESSEGFIYDPEVSWYGPGFYGNRTACGLAYTKTILGVAHRTLPCGTEVTFMWEGKQITVPVIDRGPYVDDRQWDLSGGLCVELDHCFTGAIYYRIEP